MVDILPEASELPNLLQKQKSKLLNFNSDYRPYSYWGPQLL